MKIKLTQEQADNFIVKMLVKDYTRMVARNDIQEDGKILEAFQVLLGEYYLTSDEFFEVHKKACNKLQAAG